MQTTGHVIRSRYMYARRQGDDAFAKVLAALGPEARAIMQEGPLETVWYPYTIYVEISRTIDAVLGAGDLQLVFEMGAFSCENNLTGIYRVFFRFGNLNFLIERAAKAWHSQYDFGSMKCIRDPDNSHRVALELSNVPEPTMVLFLAVKGWVFKAAELSGSELTKVEDHYSDEPNVPMRWVFEYV